jgi:hypothetical protein
MPTNITIVQAGDFIRARPDGKADLDASRQLLVDVVSAMRTTDAHNVLIDTRAAGPFLLSTSDLWTLGVAAGTQPALARGRVALLVPLEQHDEAAFFEDVARMEGANVKAFTSFEAAISWLILREESRV